MPESSLSAATLPLTFSGYRALPEARHHSRAGRRLSGRYSERLSGDVALSGYYTAELRIGTPPQSFNVIVDTGSSVTAVPCTGCSRCGKHANARFDPSLSLSFARVACAEARCASCLRGGECGYSVTYQEGSSYSGYLARDVIHLAGSSLAPTGGAGSRPGCVPLTFAFGCSTQESGLFRSQRADGIMGLAPSRAEAGGHPTVHEALLARGAVADGFSLCLGRAGGALTFGLPATEEDGVMWSPVEEPAFYGVGLASLTLGDAPLPLPAGRALVDSGTTFLYLPARSFAPLLAAMQARHRSHAGCAHLHGLTSPRDEFCVRLPSPRAPPAPLLDGCFAELRIGLAGGPLLVSPSRYFYPSEAAGEHCLGIFSNYEPTMVLGAIALVDTMVTFDRERRRVGFRRRHASKRHAVPAVAALLLWGAVARGHGPEGGSAGCGRGTVDWADGRSVGLVKVGVGVAILTELGIGDYTGRPIAFPPLQALKERLRLYAVDVARELAPLDVRP